MVLIIRLMNIMKANNDSYNKELFKTISVIIGLFIISCIISGCFIANSLMQNLSISVEKDKMLIVSDFRKLHFSHTKQIKWLKSEIEQIELDHQSLDKLFKSDKIQMIDKTSISAIIITDQNKNILYSDLEDGVSNQKKQSLAERVYLDQVKIYPNQVIIGDIVTGVLTGLPSIPISISLLKDNTFNGAVVFSITLDNLSRHLIKNSLISILIKEKSNIVPLDLNNTSKHSAIKFFLKKILLNQESIITFTVLENLSGKYIELNYDVNLIFQEFVASFSINALLIFCILSLILAFYYYRILLPLQPALTIINNLPLYNQLGNRSLFSLINTTITDQSKAIALHENAHHEQLLKLISIIHSFSAVTEYVKNKLEFLAENISDINFDSSKLKLPKHYKKTLTEIEETVIHSNQDIKRFFINFIKISETLKTQDKEEVDLLNILEQGGVNSAMINEYNVDQKIQKTLYKTLIETLFTEIINIKQEELSLYQVGIDINRIDFVFKQRNNFIMINCDEKLITCKIWGLFNNISIEIDNQENHFIISCYFNNNITIKDSNNQ